MATLSTTYYPGWFEEESHYVQGTGKIYVSPQKRMKWFYPLICDPDNIIKAQYKAQQRKGDRHEIQNFNENIVEKLQNLWEMLEYETYIPGEYRIKKIYEPKERIIMIAPFFPDRIIHHCILNVLAQHWQHLFINNTYSCIKGRGITKCMEDVHRTLILDKKGTQYCLKIDIKKFYDNVDHSILKYLIRFTIADEKALRLLDKIIDSNGMTKGLPIGNYTSQYLANIYLTYFDHWVKEVLRVKYYYRYMDDMVFLGATSKYLHDILDKIGLYLAAELKVELKQTWQIFPVDDRSIDFVGFKQNHFGILLRKGILYNFYNKFNQISEKYLIGNEDDFKHLFPSEYGWIIRCTEEHSNFILNKCINDGNNKYFNYWAA